MTTKSMNRDPIYALIERQKHLGENWHTVSVKEPRPNTPKYPAWSNQEAKAGNTYNTGIDKLLRTKPTTAAGLVALIEFCLNENTGLFRNSGSTDDCVKLLELVCKAIPKIQAA